MLPVRRKLFALMALTSLSATLIAGDWPQILGPDRNGKSQQERLATKWPNGGPPTVWERGVGSGFAGVAVARRRVILFHRQDDQEVVEALDAATGKGIWQKSFPTRYASQVVDDDGPRCVPLVHGDSVYVYGAEGVLHCLGLADGAIKWSRDARRELSAPDGYFGAGSSPLVEGSMLLVNIGARRGAGLVAFSLDTGETIWQATDEEASYSSPVATTIDGVRHVVFVTRLNCLSIDPRDGHLWFRFAFGARGPTVNAANPLIIGCDLFLSASYGVGAKLVRIEGQSAKEVWENDTTLSSQYTTAVEHQGLLYGIHGRQDVGVAELRCIDPTVGRVLWSEPGYGMATLILGDEKLVIVKTDGQLVLATPSPQGYSEIASARLFNTMTRALPALANGLLYVRDTQTLRCVDLGAR